MSWRESLRPASFRGAAFHVPSHSAEVAGRRVQVHEYPNRDKAFPEDLGRKAPEYSMQAYVIGADYMKARDALLAACNEEGPGQLVHPYLGRLAVICTGCRLSERTDEGGVARLSLTFVDAGENSFPKATEDTAHQVAVTAAAAAEASETSFTERFDVAGRPAFVAADAAALVNDAVTAVETSVAGRLSTAFLRDVRTVAATVDALVQAPARLAGAVTGLVGGIVSEATSTVAGIGAVRSLTGFGSEVLTVPAVTATRLRQAANRVALTGLVRRAAVIEMARAAPKVAFDHAGEAMALRDEIGGLLDVEMDAASAAGDDAVFDTFRGLRTAVVRDLGNRAPALAELVEASVAATEPALVTAYRLYGDAGRSEEVARRNRLRHPGFVPGGNRVEVLTDV